MGPESNLWHYVSRGMKGLWHATRHEDRATPGIPDVSFGLDVDASMTGKRQGWIELKRVAVAPKDEYAIMKLPSFTGVQRRWLKDRDQCGGSVFMLLQLGKTYFIFNGEVAAEHVGRCSTKALYTYALKHWDKSVNFHEFELILRGRKLRV